MLPEVAQYLFSLDVQSNKSKQGIRHMIKSTVWFLATEEFYIKLCICNINCSKNTKWFHNKESICIELYEGISIQLIAKD